ncbi:hypothetical protein ACN38_g8529 [Penicillium nordicum]|uniref:Uncharacterized protein n=1 Tax=Penicillium nordicum TaxID=229535 RepID=A0A0M8NW83_9EURO|nr:hypothetical protein ACN38_g8529 [Penicillium nordicum]
MGNSHYTNLDLKYFTYARAYDNSGIHIFCRQIFRHIQASILLILVSEPSHWDAIAMILNSSFFNYHLFNSNSIQIQFRFSSDSVQIQLRFGLL